MKKIIVLAGSYKQFLRFLSENGLTKSDAVYADFPEKLYGIEASEVIEYGTYYDNPNFHKLKEIALRRVK